MKKNILIGIVLILLIMGVIYIFSKGGQEENGSIAVNYTQSQNQSQEISIENIEEVVAELPKSEFPDLFS